MTQHTLQGRTDDEVLWFQRRSFLKGAATWTALGGFGAAFAQGRSNVIDFQGDILINGSRMLPQQTVQTGDALQTGPNSMMVFVIGNTAFQVRQNSRLRVDRGASINAVSVLRMITGAVGAVWGKGVSRQIITPTLTAGIRGTGVYSEILENRNGRSYFCNCYGVVEMDVGREKTLSKAQYHRAYWIETEATTKDGRLLVPAKALNHTDEEQEYLARLVSQRTTWQITGVKGSADGSEGY
ncbi:MAG: iron dicitrate transport regulator FecR [Burkholderiaceae bacterium]